MCFYSCITPKSVLKFCTVKAALRGLVLLRIMVFSFLEDTCYICSLSDNIYGFTECLLLDLPVDIPVLLMVWKRNFLHTKFYYIIGSKVFVFFFPLEALVL